MMYARITVLGPVADEVRVRNRFALLDRGLVPDNWAGCGGDYWTRSTVMLHRDRAQLETECSAKKGGTALAPLASIVRPCGDGCVVAASRRRA